jgi:large subunit ribosomal protein L19
MLKRAHILKKVEGWHIKADAPKFDIGDQVEVHQKILEGQKERVQIFSGTVIGKRGGGLGEMYTVRRIVQGEGVERTFPIHSPKIAKVVVKRTGRVRRAKLYYLRNRVGKATRLRERRKGAAEVVGAETETAKKNESAAAKAD